MRLRGLLACLLLAAAVLLTLAAPQAGATPVFLSALDMSDAGQDAFEPQVVVDQAGNTLMVWTRSDGTNTRIQFRFRHSDGTLDPVDTISDAGDDAFEPALAVDSTGNAVAVWTRYQSSKTMVQAAVRPAGGSFGMAVTLSASGQSSDSPQVSFDASGKAVAVWVRYDSGGSTSNVQASVRPSGGSFGAVQSLTVPGQYAYEPQVAAGVDADNNAAACWTRYDGAAIPNLRIQCARRRNVTGYPRPQSATPIFAPLVVAYNGCTSSNQVHALPLNSASCNPAVRSSSVLTVGSPDANSFQANFSGSIRLKALVGDLNTVADEADVDIAIDIHDVRNNPGGSDYVGRLLATSQLQVTDRKNADETPEPATVQPFPLNMPVDCVNDGVATSGANCSLHSSVDALIPGAVVERQFAVWELGQFEVKDAGPNGTGYASCPPTCGDGDESVYLRQGVFAP
jgi:hypothetical protein